MSLARAHRTRVLAAQASGEPAPAPVAARISGQGYGLLSQYQAAVAAALSALAPMPDLKERQAHKKKVLPQIMPFVDSYVLDGDCYPNDVAVQAMIWLFDVGDIERGLKLALHLIDQGVHRMPRRFDRGMQTFVCDAVYDWASEQLKANQPAAPYLADLIAALEQQQWDLHPAVASKLYAMAAKHAERTGECGEAVTWCLKAQSANPEGAGVKAMLDRCLRAAKLNAEAEETEQ